MRRVGLGFPPCMTVHGEARMPLLQHLSSALYNQIQSSMQTNDALRLRGGPNRCDGYLPSPQRFTRPVLASMGTNAPGNMQPGLRIVNSRPLVGASNGASAGM